MRMMGLPLLRLPGGQFKALIDMSSASKSQLLAQKSNIYY